MRQVCVCVWKRETCLYDLTQDPPQHFIVDIVYQDEAAVVGEDVLVQRLQLLVGSKAWSLTRRQSETRDTCRATYTFPLATQLPGHDGQSDLQESLVVEPPLEHPAVVVQLLLTHTIFNHAFWLVGLGLR